MKKIFIFIMASFPLFVWPCPKSILLLFRQSSHARVSLGISQVSATRVHYSLKYGIDFRRGLRALCALPPNTVTLQLIVRDLFFFIWGECHSSDDHSPTFAQSDLSPHCVSMNFDLCQDTSALCIGERHSIFVFKLTGLLYLLSDTQH